jgi:hypothetical protein
MGIVQTGCAQVDCGVSTAVVLEPGSPATGR